MSVSKNRDPSSKILFITGPTASGKSDLAMCTAEEFGGEIICADSQTVRRGMDIGTAKPTPSDQKRVPHHLLDIIDPYERFTVAEFVERAEMAIAGIQSRGKLPIVVGGTGLYIDALLYKFQFRRESSAEYTRQSLEAMEIAELQDLIKRKGYVIPPNSTNSRHLIRTIESGQTTVQGQSLYSSFEPREGAVVIGIDPGKEVLERRIKRRVDVMLKNGFLNELEGIVQKYGQPKNRFDAIEYRIAYENRGLNTEQLHEKLVIGDRQYAKKQRAWMKRNKDIVWFEGVDSAYIYLKSISKLQAKN